MPWKTLLLAGALSVGALCAGLTQPAAAEQLLIGSTSASSSHYGYFVAVGKLVNDEVPGVEATVVETGATLDNIRRIERGQIDLGLVTTNVGQHAAAGTNDFEGRPVGLGLLWVYSPAPQNVIVRTDSGITELAGLEGARLNPGIRGSATEATAEAVLAVLGIAPDYVRGSTTDVVDMIKDDRAVGYVKSGAGARLDSSTLDIATFTPVRVLSLSDEQRARLETEMPDISVVEIPAGAAEGVPAYMTWSFGVGVAASLELSEETAYRIVKAAMEDETVQAAAMASVRETPLPELTMQYGTFPLHPGAVRYFREAGIEIPERLLPAEG